MDVALANGLAQNAMQRMKSLDGPAPQSHVLDAIADSELESSCVRVLRAASGAVTCSVCDRRHWPHNLWLNRAGHNVWLKSHTRAVQQ